MLKKVKWSLLVSTLVRVGASAPPPLDSRWSLISERSRHHQVSGGGGGGLDQIDDFDDVSMGVGVWDLNDDVMMVPFPLKIRRLLQ